MVIIQMTSKEYTRFIIFINTAIQKCGNGVLNKIYCRVTDYNNELYHPSGLMNYKNNKIQGVDRKHIKKISCDYVDFNNNSYSF